MLKATSALHPSDEITVAFEPSIDEAGWAAFVARASPPLRFLTHGWWQAWADAMLPHGNWRGPLRFAVARDRDGRIQAVLPAASQVMLGLSVLSLAGNYKPFRSWLIAEDAPDGTAAALVGFFRQTGIRAFRMGPVIASQPAIRSLKEAFTAAGWQHCVIHQGTNYLIELPADAEAWQASLAPGKFKRIRANLNRLKKQGEVRIEHRSNLDAAGWRAALADAATIERASWLTSVDDGDFNYADPAVADFWQRYLAHPAASRAMHLWLLYLDNRPISFTVTIDSGDHSYNICGLYDQAIKKGSPGAVIDREAFVDSFAKGVRVIDLGQGDSGYKANWGAATHEPIEDWIAFPPTTAGRLLHLGARAKFGRAPSCEAE